MAELIKSPTDLAAYPHGTQSALAEKVQEYWDDNLQIALDNKFYLPFTCTPPELDLINKLVAPLVVCNPAPARSYGRLRTGAPKEPSHSFGDNFSIPVDVIRHPEHTVARALATIGDYFLRRKIAGTDSATVNEIGPAPAKIPNLKHHSCTSLSGRDVARFGAALANHPKCTTLRSALAGKATKDLCITGVQNCNKQSLILIASDSLYDITPAQLAAAMKRKGCQVVYATLWRPHQLLCPDGDYENDIYHLKIKNGKAIMDFKDAAFAYEHKVSTWRTWAFGCSYSDKKIFRDASVAIVWENIQSWGPFSMIQVTRVHDKCEVARPMPLNSTLVGVPNFTQIIDVIVGTKARHWIFGSKNWRQARRMRVIALAIARAAKIWLPREFFSKMMQFGFNRKDNDMERNILGAAVTAKAARIEVDAFVLQHGLKLGGVEHRDLTLSLMLIITAGRQLQTQLISKVLKRYKEGDPGEGFFISIWHEIFGDDKAPFGNVAGLSAAARVMAGDGPLTDLIANCVDEGYTKEYIRSKTNALKSGRLVNTLTGRGGNGHIEACGCVTAGKDWSTGSNWCVHGVPYAGKHTKMVPIEDVEHEDNYRYYTNLDKSASVLKVFQEYSEGKILNSCAAPGNDGNIGFNRSNHSSKYLDRVQPTGKWDLDGNVHCEKCQLAMGFNCPNQFLDYGSPCESDYFHPELLSEDWNKGNKYIVKVQKGLELLKQGCFPEQFLGHYIAPIKANGAEVYVANFQGNKGWLEIIKKEPAGSPTAHPKSVTPELLTPTVPSAELIEISKGGENKPTSGSLSMPWLTLYGTHTAEGTANTTNSTQIDEGKLLSILDGTERTELDVSFGFEVNENLVSGVVQESNEEEEAFSDHVIGTTSIMVHAFEEPGDDKYKPKSTAESSVAEGTANVIPDAAENKPTEEILTVEEHSEQQPAAEGTANSSHRVEKNKPTSDPLVMAEGTANSNPEDLELPMLIPAHIEAEDLGSDEEEDIREAPRYLQPRGEPEKFPEADAIELQEITSSDEPLEETEPGRSRRRSSGGDRERDLNPATRAAISAMDSDTVCPHNFPKEPGCPGCLPPFKMEAYTGKWGEKWYDPATETECFASALLGRPATRKDIPLLLCIQSAQEPKKLEAYVDPTRYDYLSNRILQLLAAAMDIRIIIDFGDGNSPVSYGKGMAHYLQLRDDHFTRWHNPCNECAIGELYYCTDVHKVEWEKIQVPEFEITATEKNLIKRELTQEKRFTKFHAPILDHLEKHNKEFEINMVVGVAGSGKTRTAMEMLKGVEELTVIVPTRELKVEYDNKYQRPGLKTQVWSHFCRDPTYVKAILVDEIYMQHPLVVAIAANHCDELYGIGDPDQNDYGGKGTSRVIEHISRAINTATTQINCSRSVPQDVCRVMLGLGIKIKTHSKVQKSIFPVVHMKPRKPSNGMCFMNKEEVKNEWKTVNKMQGARFKHGTLYLDRGFQTAAQLRPARGVYVGLTRHTERLDVYCRSKNTHNIFDAHHTCIQGGRTRRGVEGSTEFEQTSIAIGEAFTSRKRAQFVEEDVDGEKIRRIGNKFDVAESSTLHCTVPESFAISNFIFDQPLLPSTQPFHESNDVEEEAADDELIHSYVGHLGASFADAEEVLEKISPTNSQVYQPERDLEFGYLGRNFSGKKLSLQIPDQVAKSKALHLVTAARVRGRACKSSDYSQTVQTVLGRYSKKVQLATGREAQIEGEKLFAGVQKVLPKGLQKISHEEYANAQAAQIDRIAAKKENQYGIFGDGYDNTEKITFFLKQQIKSDLKPNSWLRGGFDGFAYNLKAGQGVSAQAKALNHIVGAWVTAAERKIVESLDPRVILGYGRSPAQLRAKLKKMFKFNKISDEVLCCDISEQDTSKGEWTNWFMRLLYRQAGVPEVIIDLIECANINWRIDGNGVRLRVKHKYQSGRGDTLFANTMMNLGKIMSTVEIKALKVALLQGDDSYLRAMRIRLLEEDPNLKVERGPFGDFIGFLIGENDIFLDLPRFAVKLMNRTFASDQEINEYRVAVYDWLRVFQDAEQLHMGLKLNAAKYRTTEEDMAILFDFLRQFYLGNLFRTMGKGSRKLEEPESLKTWKRANPNCVLTETMPIQIGVSDWKVGPLSTMPDLNLC